ncbi:RNA-binding domain-containing protein [Patellaria atrata CBS 101060]|uniref:Multiple RNA-binding domain-containing protein 1 n=1 Tax=Patellaria atrata CBS 101060 TaxID=1346257 RepID=A0A9P4VRG6_9PEZI|nr:RNA-binding domain-containing protein [Patellaria atrata CBS 101060]
MASSRIFVKGLPPTFSQDEFNKHFSRQYPITDAKFFPHRRIGYVGYKNHEDAAKAVKYFNKSYIRMSRISVEIARPIDNTVPIPKGESSHNVNSKQSPHQNEDQPLDNPLKRKRTIREGPGTDPKLTEYLEVMQPHSKRSIWENHNSNAPVTSEPAHDVEEQTIVEDGDSDSEYEVVPKKSKNASTSISNTTSVGQAISSTNQDQENDQANPPAIPDEEVPTVVPRDTSQSDADWLRSKTSRLLELDDGYSGAEGTRVSMSQDKDTGPAEEMRNIAVALPNQDTLEETGPATAISTDQVKTESDTNKDTGRLFLRNLPYTVTEDDLREYFNAFGSLDEVHIPIDSRTGAGKGFAYVQFLEPSEAIRSKETLDGTIFQGRLLHIIPANVKRESRLDEYAISQLPLKKQKQIQKRAEAASSTFNWNALYMNTDAVMASVADRLGVNKGELLDPTSSDAAVKQAHAETHVIQETKSYFVQNGVDLDSFKRKARGDTAILVKNFPYETKVEELRKLFEEHGKVLRVLMPPSGTIAIVEYAQAPEARAAFKALAYRKIKDSVLFLEKAPKDVFDGKLGNIKNGPRASSPTSVAKLSTTDLLGKESTIDTFDTATLFVRNLNFTTTSERLTETFKPLDGFMSAVVKTKPDPKNLGKTLSMGFGFLEFRTKSQAQAAQVIMDGYDLEGHKLVIKASHKGLDAAQEQIRKDQAKKAAAVKTKIIIKNLPFQASKKDVRALFGAYGQLRSVRVPKKFDSSTRGFAFAEFATPREAQNAIDALGNTHFYGRKLVLDFAEEGAADAEEELEKMQKKVGSQLNRVALQQLTGVGRKKFNVSGNEDEQDV